MQTLFPPTLSTFLGSIELTIFLLSCGAVVREQESLKALAHQAKR